MLLCHSFCCILRTCLGCIVRLVHAYYICTYTGSRKLSLLQQLSLQHVMVSELCTDFTATLHLSPGLYSSYSRLSSFMSILCMICTSCDFFTSCTTSLHFTLICHFPLHTSHVTATLPASRLATPASQEATPDSYNRRISISAS